MSSLCDFLFPCLGVRLRSSDQVGRCLSAGAELSREIQFQILPVVLRYSLHEVRGEDVADAYAKEVETEESLKVGALVDELTDTVPDKLHDI